MKTVVSVSKRTDIPNWYSNWFMDRLRAGTVTYKNPMGPQVVTVSLKPEDVSAFAFWTKDFGPMMKHLQELRETSIPFYVLFTLNDYPTEYELKVRPIESRIATFQELASAGVEVHWRYDPIIISPATPVEFHGAKFAELVSKLEGFTKTCRISFLDMYAKTTRNMGRLAAEWHPTTASSNQCNTMTTTLAGIAKCHGIELQTCAESGIPAEVACQGACIDPKVIQRLVPGTKTLKGTGRDGCNCVQHRDIGAYDTCPTGCSYCYAVNTREQAVRFIKTNRNTSRTSLVPLHG
jgi:hypothetical protein